MTAKVIIINKSGAKNPPSGSESSNSDDTGDDAETIFLSSSGCVPEDALAAIDSVLKGFDKRSLRLLGLNRLVESAIQGKSQLALDFARLCYQERLEQGLSQSDVSEDAGISIDVVRRIETASGKKGASIDHVLRYIEALECSLRLTLRCKNVTSLIPVHHGMKGTELVRTVSRTCRSLADNMSSGELNSKIGRPLGHISRLERVLSSYTNGATISTIAEIMNACSVKADVRLVKR